MLVISAVVITVIIYYGWCERGQRCGSHRSGRRACIDVWRCVCSRWVLLMRVTCRWLRFEWWRERSGEWRRLRRVVIVVEISVVNCRVKVDWIVIVYGHGSIHARALPALTKRCAALLAHFSFPSFFSWFWYFVIKANLLSSTTSIPTRRLMEGVSFAQNSSQLNFSSLITMILFQAWSGPPSRNHHRMIAVFVKKIGERERLK